MLTPDVKNEDPIEEARFQPEPPVLLGDVGDDSAFATETHPEGLRYGETPHPPGSVEHGSASKTRHPVNGDLSIG